jgi:hypothetical protein
MVCRFGCLDRLAAMWCRAQQLGEGKARRGVGVGGGGGKRRMCACGTLALVSCINRLDTALHTTVLILRGLYVGAIPIWLHWHDQAVGRQMAMAMARPGAGVLIAGRSSLFKRAPYKQQAVENQSSTCQIKTDPSSWTTAAASFGFYLASARLAPVVALASTSFANPAFLLLAMVLVRALRGIQSPAGEKTEISLL